MFNPAVGIVAVTACFYDIEKSDKIGIDITVRIVYGISDSGLGGKIHHYIGMMIFKDKLNQFLIGYGPFDKSESLILI